MSRTIFCDGRWLRMGAIALSPPPGSEMSSRMMSGSFLPGQPQRVFGRTAFADHLEAADFVRLRVTPSLNSG